MDAFVGEVRMFPYMRFAPYGWLACDGARYSGREYLTLFAVIGNTYGGDGITYFNVPDLQGRAVIGAGQQPGATNYVQGVTAGSEQVALTRTEQLPVHTHTITLQYLPYKQEPAAYSTAPVAGKSYPSRYWYNLGASGSVPTYAAFSKVQTDPPSQRVSLDAKSVGFQTGSSTAHENRQPFVVLRACICFDGIFPPRP